MTSPTDPAATDSVLLVEGQSDKHLIWQLCNQHASQFCTARDGDKFTVTLPSESKSFQLVEKGNRSDLIKSIRLEVRVPDRRVIGILADADDDAQRCWTQVAKEFEKTDIDLPTYPRSGGTIVETTILSRVLRVGIWIMPDNKSRGELEDFVFLMVPDRDRVWPLSREYIRAIPPSDRKYAKEKVRKAKLYAWLAARKEPGRMGAAVGAGDLQTDGTLCQEFLSWLAELFR